MILITTAVWNVFSAILYTVMEEKEEKETVRTVPMTVSRMILTSAVLKTILHPLIIHY